MGYEMLELYEAKVSCTVLRGERRSNPPDLPDDCGTIRHSIHSERPYPDVHLWQRICAKLRGQRGVKLNLTVPNR